MKENDVSFSENSYKKNKEISNLTSLNLIKNKDKSLITNCKCNIKIIYCKKGGICVFCRTMFKIISSLEDHQKKCCRSS